MSFTKDAAPIRQPPCRLPLAKQQEATEAIEEMKRDRVIEPPVSPWAAPIVLVRKKDRFHVSKTIVGLFCSTIHVIKTAAGCTNKGGYMYVF